ncbi:hypothetical protein SDJN03_00754, partial [Cucurbita argyrosperma subsp. sororia]
MDGGGDSSLHQSHLLRSRFLSDTPNSQRRRTFLHLVVYETAALALTLAIKQLSGGGCDSIGRATFPAVKIVPPFTEWQCWSIMKLAQRNHSGDLEDANEALGINSSL